MTDNNTNLVCRYCDEAHEGINGRFCRRYNVYVEHTRVEECDKKG